MDGREHTVRQDGSLLHLQQSPAVSQRRLRDPSAGSVRVFWRLNCLDHDHSAIRSKG